MPHAIIEMPSVLAEDSRRQHTMNNHSTATSHTRPSTDLPNHIRQSHEKVNGTTPRTSSHASIKNGVVLDGDYSVGADQQQHENALASMPNGRTSAGSWENRPLRSESQLSQLSSHREVNGVSDGGRKSPPPSQVPNGVSRVSNGDRGSFASANGVLTNGQANSDYVKLHGSPVEPFNKTDVPAPISTNPGSTGPLTYTSSLTPASPLPNTSETPPRSHTVSPHRFSSPPAFVNPLSQAPTASSSSLAPTQPPLKHRHTLQVPKPGAGRSSRDGEDGAYSSGRFSPTAVASGGFRRGSLSLNRRNTQSIHSNMPHDEIQPDEDAARWAEAVRQKRASKRKRKDDEEDDRVVVGTKVDQDHVNWVTAYNMLTGIRFTVSRTNAKMDRPLTDADFDARHKFSFDITGNELTPSAKYDFKFKDYAPWVFRHLRAKFKLDPADYLMSLTSKYILSELGSPGKSGSFFYFSRDYKYIIKTIHHGEHKFLRKILKEYYQHVEENPNTLLSQFYGLHRVKVPYGRKIHFVVMNNLFPPHRDIHQTFDLKGSTIGRDFKEEDLEKNPRATLKDLNWLRRDLNIELGPEKKKLFIEQMEKDVRLMQKLKIMDYSMLVGVHDLKRGNEENLRDKTLQVFQPGGDTTQEEPDLGPGKLMRTPSKLETMRKAKELRQMIKQEKPIPMGDLGGQMPELEENITKKDFIFYSDDGGFRATHEDNSPGDEIFFLSIIDCLTHWGTVKRLENFWKGLSNDKKLLSPINPEPYGERFIKFIESITRSPEEAQRSKEAHGSAFDTTNRADTQSSFASRRRSNSLGAALGLHPHHQPNMDSAFARAEEAADKKKDKEKERPDPRTLGVVRSPSAERTGGLHGQILPVLEEGKEGGDGSSNGGRSIRSYKSVGDLRRGSGDGRRPRTPMKDTLVDRTRLSAESARSREGRPRTPIKDAKYVNGVGSRDKSPMGRSVISRESLDKDLPPLPRVS